jgi:PII-like signaling protein
MDKLVTMVRIYIREGEHGRRTILMQEVLNILHDQQHVHGVTVFRGIAGFGSTGEIHAADLLRLNVELPLVIEFFDEPEIADAAMRELQDLVPDCHMVHWPAECSISAAKQA